VKTDVRRRWARWRDRIRDRPVTEVAYRILVAVVGVGVLALGLLAIPYPGPGWAIVFIGLGILATEFRWAQRLLAYTKRHYDKAMTWFRAQGLWVQAAGIVFTTAVVLATLWLLGAIGWFAALIGVDSVWLKSPIGVGR
jgi:uncharacterized protein (TIGR02611 family)